MTEVRDVMTTTALSVAPDMRVNDAWQILAERQVGQAPVVDALGRVIGLLLRADMAPLDLLPEPGASLGMCGHWATEPGLKKYNMFFADEAVINPTGK